MFEDAENKKNNQPAAPTPAGATPEAKSDADGKVYTMPMEYYLGSKTVESTNAGKPIKKSRLGAVSRPPMDPGKKKKILNVIIIAVLVIVVGVSAYLLYKSYEKPAETQLQPIAEIQPMPAQPAPVVEEEKPAEVVLPEEEPITPVVETVEKFDPSKINKFTLSLLSGPDADKDGLTDVEEGLFGTKENMIDSDGDVYKDKEEIENFYSPIDAGSVRLWEMENFKYYTNSNYGYRILYPVSWLIQPLNSQDPSDLMISSNQNEFINILIDEKPAEQSLKEWYLAQVPNVAEKDLKTYKTFNEYSALESPDAFTVYLEKDGRVFIINYNIGLKEEASFPNIFQMVVNSFEFTPAELSTVDVPEISVEPEVSPAVAEEEYTPPPVSIEQ